MPKITKIYGYISPYMSDVSCLQGFVVANKTIIVSHGSSDENSLKSELGFRESKNIFKPKEDPKTRIRRRNRRRFKT